MRRSCTACTPFPTTTPTCSSIGTPLTGAQRPANTNGQQAKMNGQPGHQAASWNACSACFLVLLIRDLLAVSDVMRRSGCEPEWCTAFVLCIKPTDGCSHPGPPSLRTLQDDCLPAGLLPARPCRAGILPGHPGALLPAFSVDASCLLPAATARPLGWLPRCCLAVCPSAPRCEFTPLPTVGYRLPGGVVWVDCPAPRRS